MRTRKLLVLAVALGMFTVGLSQEPGSPIKPSKMNSKGSEVAGPIVVRPGTQPEMLPLWGEPNPHLKKPIDRSYVGDNSTPSQQDLAGAFGNDAFSTITTWVGLPQHGTWRPPDCETAVGGNWVIQVTNVRWAVYDKCGNQLMLENFATTLNSSRFIFDPKVIYDPWARRFVMLALEKDDATLYSKVVLMASASENPLGNWYVYRFSAETGSGADVAWADYYDLSYGPEAVYMAGNQFRFSNDSFTGAQLIVVNKSQMYDGLATNYWRPFPLTNSDGSSTFGPRAAKMMSSVGAFDTVLVSTIRLGSNWLYINEIDDPLNTRTQTKSRVDIGAYAVAPNAVQPGGDVLFGFDARVMSAYFVRDITDNTYHMWLGFMTEGNFGGGATEMVNRIINYDPVSNTLKHNANFGATDYAYVFPAIAPNYEGEAIYTFGRVANIASQWAEHRYTVIEKNGAGGYTVAGSVQIQNGTGVYTQDNRWGDYFGASLDWGDYYSGTPFGSAGKHKLWAYGQWAVASSSYGTSQGATLIDAAAGFMVVSANPAVRYDGNDGVHTGFSYPFYLTNTGDVSYAWELQSKPTWVDASISQGEVFSGTSSQLVTFTTNANSNALGFGRHVGSVVFRNCFSGATVSRQVTLSVGDWLNPDWLQVTQGELFDGDISSVLTSDNVRLQVFNSPTTLACEVWFRTDAGVDNGDILWVYVESRVARPGLSEEVYVWNWDTTTWVVAGGRVAPTSDSAWYPLTNSPNAAVYTSNAGRIYHRMIWQPINDEDPAQDGWLHSVDHTRYFLYP